MILHPLVFALAAVVILAGESIALVSVARTQRTMGHGVVMEVAWAAVPALLLGLLLVLSFGTFAH